MNTISQNRLSSPRTMPCLRSCPVLGKWAAAGLALLLAAAPSPTAFGAEAAAAPARPPQKWRDFNEVIQGTDRYEGLFALYRTNDTLYAAIKPNMMDQPLLVPIMIARGLASAGTPLNFGDEWIIMFHRVGDKVQLIRRNIHYQAPSGTPLEKAVKQNYVDSVLMALPIVTMNGGEVLVDFSQIFLSDFANLRLGTIDRNRCNWHKIKTFANNIELEVSVTFAMGGPSAMSVDDGVADPRGVTLVIHYSLAKLPDAGYRPRHADHRVGHFLSANKDFGSNDPDTQFVRLVNRWRLEKADPRAKMSAPKRQLVWWVEDTVPHEYRSYVQDGILEWNKAFEKIGFRDAIGVRWQNERDEFDPEDINYCTFRWIATPDTFARSCLRANPLTGEMIDGDVIFDASWVREWKMQYAILVGKAGPTSEDGAFAPLAAGEIISPIMADKQGFGLSSMGPSSAWNNPMEALLRQEPHLAGLQLIPADMGPMHLLLRQRLNSGNHSSCCLVSGLSSEFSLAAMVFAAAAGDKKEGHGKLPEEFLGQAIKEVVMHEVGHSLGLRHNFKASTLLKPEELNDTAITSVKGMGGSVMDYNPLNFAPKGQKQGDYASTTIGPYDYWAIEYAYKPIDGDEAAELTKIAARSPEKELTYATDEDMRLNNDPYVNTYDLGSDPLRYGMDRVALAEELLKNLDENVVKNGESWARLRSAFSILLNQYGNAAYMASSFIGGQEVARDFKGTEKGRDPITPIPGDKQREAMRFLVDKILTGKTFQFSPALLRRLTTQNWSHWGHESVNYGSSVDYPIYNRILSIQRIILNRFLNGSILSRLQNQALQAGDGGKPIEISEIFDALTDSIWPDPKSGEDAQSGSASQAIVRRNLQREYLRRLCAMVLGSRRSGIEDAVGYVMFYSGASDNVPADAKSLARQHLKEINARIGRMQSYSVDKTTSAHLQESQQRISKILEAAYMATD